MSKVRCPKSNDQRPNNAAKTLDIGLWTLGLSRPTILIGASHDRTESLLILARGDERADHAVIISRFPVVQNIQPEVVPVLVRVSSQVTKILHQHKCRIVLLLLEGLRLDQIQQHSRP